MEARGASVLATEAFASPAAAMRTWVADRSYPMLDSVRAIAATSVFLRHTGIELGLTGTAAAFAEHLNLGLMVFFVLSGFLLYRPFARAALAAGSVNVRRYAVGRLLRIVPAYWVALSAVILVGASPAVGEAVRLYGFAQVYDTDTILSGIGQAWTLDVEMTFYAALPLLALGPRTFPVLDRRARAIREAVTLGALLLVSQGFKVWYVGEKVYADHGIAWLSHTILWFGDAFIAGMAIALMLEWRAGEGGRSLLRVRRAWPMWVAAASLYVVHSAFDARLDQGAGLIAGHWLDIIAATLIFLPAVSGSLKPGAVRAVLTSRTLTYLGVISYSFYLLHYLVLAHVVPFDSGVSGVPLAVVAFGLAVVVAFASWYAVERPALIARDLIVPKRARRGTGEATPDAERQAAP